MDTTNLPKSRAEAKATGAKYYFTGEACKHGHVAPRKTKGACVECMKVEWTQGNITRAAYFADYNKSEAGQQAKQSYYAKNKEQVIARAQARPSAEKQAHRRKHKQENPERYKELTNSRRRRYKEATPKWLSVDQRMEIRLKYRLALELSRRTGVPYAVDHIIPIQGELVSGLNVPWNLQVITQAENLKKSNKLAPPEIK